MIELADYWMGRDLKYPLSMSTEIAANAARTVEIANKLLVLAKASGVRLQSSPITHSIVASGWRPPMLNANTPGAAPNSRHITGQAIDIYDPDGDIDEWLFGNQQPLVDLGVWAEHPGATKGWSHWQIVPPRSGRRFFYP